MSERQVEIMESTHGMIMMLWDNYQQSEQGIAESLNVLAESSDRIFLRDIHHPDSDQSWTAADVRAVLDREDR